MKPALKSLAAIFEGAESIVPITLAMLLVAFGPLIWVDWLISAHHTTMAITVGAVWAVSAGIVGYELRKKAITALSLFVFLSWLVVLVGVFAMKGYDYPF